MQIADQKTGVIEVEDVKKLLSKRRMTFEEECDEIFKIFDYDNRGFIKKPKLKVIAAQMCKNFIEDFKNVI